MNTQTQKLTFDHFHDENIEKQLELEKEQLKQQSWYNKGYEQGLKEGEQKGKATALASIEQQTLQAFNLFNEQYSRLWEELSNIDQIHSHNTLILLKKVLSKTLTPLMKQTYEERFLSLMKDVWELMDDSHNITITTSNELAENFKPLFETHETLLKFNGRFRFAPSDDYAVGQTMITWGKNRIEDHPENILQQVEKIIDLHIERLNIKDERSNDDE